MLGRAPLKCWVILASGSARGGNVRCCFVGDSDPAVVDLTCGPVEMSIAVGAADELDAAAADAAGSPELGTACTTGTELVSPVAAGGVACNGAGTAELVVVDVGAGTVITGADPEDAP